MSTHSTSTLSDANWSKGSWERTCQTRLIRQRQTTDCGVACLAMLAGITYHKAYTTMTLLGYDKSPRPMATNYKQIEHSLAQHALATKRVKWLGWEAFHGLGLLKVPTRYPAPPQEKHWHWVVAEKHPTFGIVLRDPASPLVAIETPPLNVMHQDLYRYEPYGMWLQVCRQPTSNHGAVESSERDTTWRCCAI